jgi:hypothetical protein
LGEIGWKKRIPGHSSQQASEKALILRRGNSRNISERTLAWAADDCASRFETIGAGNLRAQSAKRTPAMLDEVGQSSEGRRREQVVRVRAWSASVATTQGALWNFGPDGVAEIEIVPGLASDGVISHDPREPL